MSKAEIMSNLSRKAHRVGFKMKKRSPEILIVAGVVGTITSAVMACRATLKVHEIVDESKETIEIIHEAAENGVTEAGLEYTEEDAKKDLTVSYIQTGAKLAKLYAPSVLLGAASIFAIVKSNDILRKRNVALAAAYAAVDKGFKEYRSRVVERFGKELDHELRYNVKAKEVEEVVVDEKGKEKIVKKTVNVVDPNVYSDYARFFDVGNPNWDKDPEYNFMFLKHQMNHANELLKCRGHAFLNEVYDMIGIPRTKAGQIVGWIYDEKNPVGDNFIDFGIFDETKQKSIDFVNGYERTILLDFNVDGVIYDKI